MFELYYRVVHSEYDDFVGQNGFFQIKCNECKYGEIYPKELETVMDKVSLYDWFERLARVIKYLSLKDYVALSDVESYNTWIEFRKTNEEVMVSIVKAEKEEGSHDEIISHSVSKMQQRSFILSLRQKSRWVSEVSLPNLPTSICTRTPKSMGRASSEV